VRLGFTTMNTPDDVPAAELARTLEARGFDSLWIGEHSHIPVSRRTPYPAGGEMPDAYKRMMDPFISLTVAAAATSELRVGTGVALPLEHDVFALAKTVASVDQASRGRLLFGVGVGWNEEELADHRPDLKWSQRYRALEECVGALRALWCDDESEFHGQFFDFDRVWCAPKPVQRPHPPVVCGMAGRLGTEHAVRWADVWMPMDVALGDVAKKVAMFRAACAAAGRGDLPITLCAWGDPVLDTLLEYRDLGIERVIVGAGRVGWYDPASSVPFIDRYAELVPRLVNDR
jgi:probable F420-dependent oxidoreductase